MKCILCGCIYGNPEKLEQGFCPICERNMGGEVESLLLGEAIVAGKAYDVYAVPGKYGAAELWEKEILSARVRFKYINALK